MEHKVRQNDAGEEHMTNEEIWDDLRDDTKKVATARFIGDLVARIIIARRKQGLSPKDLAEKMRVPIYKVTEMENLDAAVIDACLLVQAALVLGVEI